MRLKHVIRQTVRGCQTLPHVGAHPGKLFFAMMLFLGAGISGWIGLVVVAGLVVPMFLIGAYDRAELSDRLEEWERK